MDGYNVYPYDGNVFDVEIAWGVEVKTENPIERQAVERL